MSTQIAAPSWVSANLHIFLVVISRSCLTQGVMDSEDIYWVEFGVAKPIRIYAKLGYERNAPKLRTTIDDGNNTSLGSFPKQTRGLSGEVDPGN